MKKILVTGGAGYIGSFMVRGLIENGFDPIILDNMSSGHKEAVSAFRLEKIDLVTQKDKLQSLFASEKFDGVIHMASYIQMGESFKNPGKYYQNNVIGFLNLLDCMVNNKVLNIVLSSSAGVYGNPVNLPIKEDDPKNPLNPYGETKYIMERMLEDYDTAYGLRFMSFRYFNAAGATLDGAIGEDHPEESHLIPNVIKKTIDGVEVEIFGNDYKTSDGTNVRDYIHVLDLVDSHVLGLKKLLDGVSSNIYNIGVGRGYSNKEIIIQVEKTTGIPVKVKYMARRSGDADSLYASIEKISTDFGWKPKYGLSEIIETAYKWHKKRPNGYNDNVV